MTDYHLIKFHLSPGQLAKARSALKNQTSLTIRVAAKDMGHGDSHLSLTAHQVASAEKKHKAGLGSQLSISHAALKHTHIHGAGFGDMLRNGAKQVASWGIRKGGNMLADYVGSGIKKPCTCGSKKVGGSILGSVGGWALHQAGNVVSGLGIKRAVKAKPKRKVGGSILGSIGGWALHQAGNVVGGLGIKRRKIGAKRHVQVASGVFAPGY